MLGWLVTFVLVLRALVMGLPLAAAFVVVTALTAGTIERESGRVLVAAAVCIGLPLLTRWRAAAFLRERGRKGAPPSPGLFLALGNLAIVCALVLGFADDVGRSLRRHGDWFVGERNGAVARKLRACVGFAALYLESFDPPPELAPGTLAPRGPPGPLPASFEAPPAPPPVVAVWFHPLAGPERALPGYACRRFGARRPQPRPQECELGHCGVDIGATLGEPVFAVFDGVVDRIQRNPDADPISGIFVVLSHREATVRSRYIHLDSVAADLVPGATVRGGQQIGRLGRTGVRHSGPHLHFGLSVRQRGHERFVDPEPYLRRWQLVTVDSIEPRLAASGRAAIQFRTPRD